MNKKLIPLLALFPVLTSCSGFPIGLDDALNNISNIEESLSEGVPNEDFNITSVVKSSSGGVETTDTNVYIYSVENKFFHTYRVYESNNPYNRGNVYESWKYVKDALDTSDNKTKTWIFEVVRDINTSIYTDDKQYNYIVTYELYSDEAWQAITDGYEKERIAVPLQNALNTSKALITNESYNLNAFSFNGNSLALQAVREIVEDSTQINKYSMNIYNTHLLSTYSSNSTITEASESISSTETIYKYSAGDIYYPEVNVTVSSL